MNCRSYVDKEQLSLCDAVLEFLHRTARNCPKLCCQIFKKVCPGIYWKIIEVEKNISILYFFMSNKSLLKFKRALRTTTGN